MDELARVNVLVEGLASAFEAGLDFYTKWKQRLESQNHYRRHVKKTSSVVDSKCALSTSFDISSHRIRATYQVGFAMIGCDFSAGDDECRESLTIDLAELEGRIDALRQAALGSSGHHFMNLNELFLASEAIRDRCITALAEQYRRLAAGRPGIPPEMPIPRHRCVYNNSPTPSPSAPVSAAPPVLPAIQVLPPLAPVTSAQDDDRRHTAVWSTNSEIPVFQSEPPSPPLTPLHPPNLPALPLPAEDDDDESCLTPRTSSGSDERGGIVSNNAVRPQSRQHSLRPNNSVFSIFCPEAMALQVDLTRPLPGSKSPRGNSTRSSKVCKCGYKWKAPEMALKDGFRMTRRFLAKSHCDQQTPNTLDEGVAMASSSSAEPKKKPGYGCVLCTSTGRTETYDTADDLRTHINAAHDKWQMLHDRDMT